MTNWWTYPVCGTNCVSNDSFSPFSSWSSTVTSVANMLSVFHFSINVIPTNDTQHAKHWKTNNLHLAVTYSVGSVHQSFTIPYKHLWVIKISSKMLPEQKWKYSYVQHMQAKNLDQSPTRGCPVWLSPGEGPQSVLDPNHERHLYSDHMAKFPGDWPSKLCDLTAPSNINTVQHPKCILDYKRAPPAETPWQISLKFDRNSFQVRVICPSNFIPGMLSDLGERVENKKKKTAKAQGLQLLRTGAGWLTKRHNNKSEVTEDSLLTVIGPLVLGLKTTDKFLGVAVTAAVDGEIHTAGRLCLSLDLVQSIVYDIRSNTVHDHCTKSQLKKNAKIMNSFLSDENDHFWMKKFPKNFQSNRLWDELRVI